MASRQEILDTVRSGVDRVEQVFTGMSDRDLESPVEVDGRQWTARDVLAFLAGRSYVYDFIIQSVEFAGMPDMHEFGPGHVAGSEAENRMVRDSPQEGAPAMGRRPGTFDLSDREWEYRAAVPHAGKEADEILTEFRQVHESLIDRIEKMPEGLLNKTGPFGDSDDTLGDVLQERGGQALHDYAGLVEEAVSSRAR